jgi:hypothetical protein
MRTLKSVVLAGSLAALGGVALSASQARAGDQDNAAITLSLIFPGVGEWYNAGFSGGYPLVECIIGTICPCVRIASLIDAAAGKTDDGIRFDFWSSPS